MRIPVVNVRAYNRLHACMGLFNDLIINLRTLDIHISLPRPIFTNFFTLRTKNDEKTHCILPMTILIFTENYNYTKLLNVPFNEEQQIRESYVYLN